MNPHDKEVTWASASRQLGYGDQRSLKNHMEKHVTLRSRAAQDVELRQAEDELDAAIEGAVEELFVSMRMAPAEVKPLYAAAIRNLRGLAETKPSQQHLIQALKTIQEMTGMKQEQRMMLQFAEAMFAEVGAAPARKALSAAVIDVVEIPDSAFASTPADQSE